jgi:peptidoglycan/LPS O-acetylase OafA/YrhL
VFYLIFPLACLVLRREVLVCAFRAIFLVVGPLWRAAHHGAEIPVLSNYLACFDAIAFGCMRPFWRCGRRKGRGFAPHSAGSAARSR